MRLLLALAVTATVAAGAVTLAQRQGPTADEFCERLAVVQDLDETLASLDPLSISAASTQLAVLHDASPDTIRDDLAVLRSFTDEIVAEVEASSGDEEQAVEAVARRTDLDAVAEAGTRVQAYARDNCDITLTSTPPPASVAPPPTPSTTTPEG